MTLYMYLVASHGIFSLLRIRLGGELVFLLNFLRLNLPLLLIFVERPILKSIRSGRGIQTARTRYGGVSVPCPL